MIGPMPDVWSWSIVWWTADFGILHCFNFLGESALPQMPIPPSACMFLYIFPLKEKSTVRVTAESFIIYNNDVPRHGSLSCGICRYGTSKCDTCRIRNHSLRNPRISKSLGCLATLGFLKNWSYFYFHLPASPKKLTQVSSRWKITCYSLLTRRFICLKSYYKKRDKKNPHGFFLPRITSMLCHVSLALRLLI